MGWLPLKASSQSDARSCVVLIRGAQKSIVKMCSIFLAIRHKNPMQRNASIESESIVASCCIATSVNVKGMQRNLAL